MREVVVGMTKLCGFTAPPSAYMTLQQVRSSGSSCHATLKEAQGSAVFKIYI